MKTACVCGLMDEWVVDSRVPIFRDEMGQVWCEVAEKQARRINFCFFCGGISSAAPSETRCASNHVKDWTEVPGSCIRFNESVNEVYLAVEDGGAILFYFCPVCGGRLAESKRAELFVAPSPE